MDETRHALLVEHLPELLPGATGVAVEWLVVNARRVDAGVTADGGREWRIVFVSDGTTAADFTVFERPPRFEGVDGGRALVLNGPSGAGKSTLMATVRAASVDPWVVFDEIVVGDVDLPRLMWPDTAPTLRTGFLAAIGALARAGNQVVLTAGAEPKRRWRDALQGVDVRYVGLDCPLPVLLERERGRPGRWGGLAEGSRRNHDGWTYDLRIDTSSTSPDDAARQVLALWNSASARSR